MTDHELRKFQGYTVVVGVALMLAKTIAYLLTGSNAILADALESFVNIAAGIVAWYSLKLAAKPRDLQHPYGHGKVELLSASVEGILIGVAGLLMAAKAIQGFFNPPEIKQLDLGIMITSGAGLINGLMGWYLIKLGKKHDRFTMSANGHHLMSDAVSSAGLIIGLLLIYLTGWHILDQIITFLFGFIILRTAFKILKKAISGVMDEMEIEVVQKLVEVLNNSRKDNWIDVHNLRVIRFGNGLHIDAHLTLPWYYSLQEAHQCMTDIEQLIRSNFSNVEFFIHLDPCIESSCAVCKMKDCEKRVTVFKGAVLWNEQNVFEDRKHDSQSL